MHTLRVNIHHTRTTHTQHTHTHTLLTHTHIFQPSNLHGPIVGPDCDFPSLESPIFTHSSPLSSTPPHPPPPHTPSPPYTMSRRGGKKTPKYGMYLDPALTRAFEAGDNVVYLYEGHFLQNATGDVEEELAMVPRVEEFRHDARLAVGRRYFCVVEEVVRDGMDFRADLIINEADSPDLGKRFRVTHKNTNYAVECIVLADLYHLAMNRPLKPGQYFAMPWDDGDIGYGKIEQVKNMAAAPAGWGTIEVSNWEDAANAYVLDKGTSFFKDPLCPWEIFDVQGPVPLPSGKKKTVNKSTPSGLDLLRRGKLFFPPRQLSLEEVLDYLEEQEAKKDRAAAARSKHRMSAATERKAEQKILETKRMLEAQRAEARKKLAASKKKNLMLQSAAMHLPSVAAPAPTTSPIAPPIPVPAPVPVTRPASIMPSATYKRKRRDSDSDDSDDSDFQPSGPAPSKISIKIKAPRQTPSTASKPPPKKKGKGLSTTASTTHQPKPASLTPKPAAVAPAPSGEEPVKKKRGRRKTKEDKIDPKEFAKRSMSMVGESDAMGSTAAVAAESAALAAKAMAGNLGSLSLLTQLDDEEDASRRIHTERSKMVNTANSEAIVGKKLLAIQKRQARKMAELKAKEKAKAEKEEAARREKEERQRNAKQSILYQAEAAEREKMLAAVLAEQREARKRAERERLLAEERAAVQAAALAAAQAEAMRLRKIQEDEAAAAAAARAEIEAAAAAAAAEARAEAAADVAEEKRITQLMHLALRIPKESEAPKDPNLASNLAFGIPSGDIEILVAGAEENISLPPHILEGIAAVSASSAGAYGPLINHLYYELGGRPLLRHRSSAYQHDVCYRDLATRIQWGRIYAQSNTPEYGTFFIVVRYLDPDAPEAASAHISIDSTTPTTTTTTSSVEKKRVMIVTNTYAIVPVSYVLARYSVGSVIDTRLGSSV